MTIAVLLLLRKTIKTYQTIDQDFLITSSRGFVLQHKRENSGLQSSPPVLKPVHVHRPYFRFVLLFLEVQTSRR